jgi:formylglycine-generating enzyme required for sulfatase activity
MGSNKAHDFLTFDNETPQHEVTLPGYWMGKYPVTVAQFREFAAEYRWADWKSLQKPGHHPMVHVTWHDALAYCRWLAGKTGLPVTLPSEAEWEKAARGTDGRLYPWGDAPPDAQRCNFNNNVGTTTPVGQYSPQGDSTYECADMAGNVWEWTRSQWKAYPYRVEEGREDLSAGDSVRRVVRGGAFDSSGRHVRCAFCHSRLPSSRLQAQGFRVVLSPSRSL